MQVLGQKRHERGREAGEGGEDLVEGPPEGPLARVTRAARLAPAAVARAAHVPVGEAVHERLERDRRGVEVVAVEGGAHLAGGAVEVGQDPAVERLAARHGRALRPAGARVEPVARGVLLEELVDVEHLEQERAPRVADRLVHEPHRLAGGHVAVEEPAEGVRAVEVEHLGRRAVVLVLLAELLPLRVEHVAEHQAALVGGPVEQGRADGVERVEPAARLVDRLADERGRERPLEPLGAARDVGVAPLRERHGARVEPAVDHVEHAPGGRPALGARDLDRVDPRAVRVELGVDRGVQLVQLLDRADHAETAAARGRALPHRQRRAPEPLARQRPVLVVGEEVAEPPVADVLGEPLDRLVARDEPLLDLGGADEPRLARVVQERGLAAPAVRVVVLVALALDQEPALLQLAGDLLVGVLDPLAGVGAAGLGERAVGPDQVQERQPVGHAHPVVVLAEGGRGVHDPAAVGGGHVLVGHDHVGRAVQLAVELKQRRVARPRQLTPLDLLHHLGRRLLGLLVDPEHAPEQGLGQHVRPSLGDLGEHVVHVGVHDQRHVGEERPGRGGPGQRVGLLVPLEPERDRDRGVLDLHVALADLVRGEAGHVARAPGQDLVTLVEQPLLGHALQRPPHRLDVVLGVGDVRVLHVEPEADAVGQHLPLALVLPDRLLAELHERLDPVALDVLLALQAQLLLDLDLDRQAVGVPAGLPLDAPPEHGLVAREQVLDHPGQHVAVVGHAVGGGRPLVEGERLAAGRPGQALGEDPGVLPEGPHRVLGLARGAVRRQGAEAVAHGAQSYALSHLGQGFTPLGRARRRRRDPRVQVSRCPCLPP